MTRERTFSAFYMKDARDYLQDKLLNLKLQVDREADDFLLRVNEVEYVNRLVKYHQLDLPRLHFDQIEVSDYERNAAKTNRYQWQFPIQPSPVKETVIVYRIPFSGNPEHLRLKPSEFLLWTTEVFTEGPFLCFEVPTVELDKERITREANHIVGDLKTQFDHLVKQLRNHNEDLPRYATDILRSRKQFLSKKEDMLKSLGVPISKREVISEVPPSPIAEKKAAIPPKPSTPEGPVADHPPPSKEIYRDIVQTTFDWGRQLERTPSAYKGKTETDLRDHLLTVLEPVFRRASTTSETINKYGKTDILVRTAKSNVFIAECMFWKGPKSYLGKVDQLLGYLTWRDSKAALVVFVKNKGFTSVLNEIKSTTLKHPNFLKAVGEEQETWLNYKIHLEGDRQREVYLSVLVFNFPSRTRGR